jgi:hypothetical protein
MNRKIIALVGVISLLAFTAWSAPGLCQGAGKQPSGPASPSEALAVTVKGKIVYDQRSHNYMFFQEDSPYSEFFIMNDNIDDLKALAESRKIIMVEGSMPRGADSLLIDKIDGKKFGKGK